MKALDAGAGGVIVPMVNSVEEAEAVVGACRYPPEGYRSMGPIRSRAVAGDWRTPICVVMIETVQAVNRDGDRHSRNLGRPRQRDRSTTGELIEKVAASARKHGVVAGIMCGSPEVAQKWHETGYQMLALESDTRLLTAASEHIVQESKELTK